MVRSDFLDLQRGAFWVRKLDLQRGAFWILLSFFLISCVKGEPFPWMSFELMSILLIYFCIFVFDPKLGSGYNI